MKLPTTSQGLEQLGVRVLLITLYLAVCALIAFWIGSGEVRLLVWCVLLAVLGVVSFGLQRRAWVLIPLAWLWFGYTAVLPLPLSIRDTAILLATCAYAGHRIVGHSPTRLRFTLLDWFVWVNVGYVVLTYFINPVGFGIFGSETVGGRPYVTLLLSVCAYQVLTRAPDSVASASRVPVYLLVSAALLAFMFLLTYVFPWLPMKVPILFAALDINVFGAGVSAVGEIPRYQRLADLGLMLSLVLCAYYPPRSLLNPTRLRFLFFLIALVCVLAAGFRNVMLWLLAAVFLGSWLHRGWNEIVVMAACAALSLGVVLAGQGRIYELPLPAQRALAFLPGQWASQVVDDVNTSSEGRFQWWRDIIKHRMIKNWWVGDGFGASSRDLESLAAHGDAKEFMMTTGAYHNGPLTAIRYVGVIGLLLLYALMGALAYDAVKYVGVCRDGPLFPMAVFIAIQAIWQPVHYTFIFGGYDNQLPQQILLTALLRLVIRMQEIVPAAGPVAPPPMPARRPRPPLGLHANRAPR